MIKVQCRTNLDIKHHAEKWPEQLPERPVVGDLIRSAMEWQVNSFSFRQLELRVCRTTWVYKPSNVKDTTDYGDYWYLQVELTLIESRFENMTAFQKWYDDLTR